MIGSLLRKYAGRTVTLNFNSRVVIELEIKSTYCVGKILKQDLDRKVNRAIRTPYLTLRICSIPELTSSSIYLMGADDGNTFNIEKNYLEQMICTLYSYAYDDYTINKNTILINMLRPLLDKEIECPNCHKMHTGDNVYCDDCLKHMSKCSVCGSVLINDDYVEKQGKKICYSCAISHSEYKWKDYSSKPEPNFVSEVNEQVYDDTRFYGFELEVEQGDDCNFNNEDSSKIISTKIDNVYFKNDGSLDSGFEIIHEPGTLLYHTNHSKSLLDLVAKLGYCSKDTTGLHIHVGKNCFGKTVEERVSHIGKLLYFSDKFFNQLVTLSFRDRDCLDYCKKIEVYCNNDTLLADNDELSKFDKYAQYVKHFLKYGNRYHCINLFFVPTVEFRLPLSTLDYEHFILQFQLFDRMIDICCNDNIDIDEVDFDVLCGKYEILDNFIKILIDKK